MAERWLPGLRDELESAVDAPCYVVDEAVAEQVTGFHVHRGALATLHRRPLSAVDEVIADAQRIVVLEDIVDSTNVGAIFRSAAALGVDAVLLSPRCADPLYRRSVKVAMGGGLLGSVDPAAGVVRRSSGAVGGGFHDGRAHAGTGRRTA